MACAVQQQLKGDTRGLIVVLDGNGRELQDLGRVIESMDRYAPSALIWVFDASANPPLSGFVRVESGLVDAGPVPQTLIKEDIEDVEVGVKVQPIPTQGKFKSTKQSTKQSTEQTTQQSMNAPSGNASGPVLRLSGGQLNDLKSDPKSDPQNGPQILGPGIHPVQASDVLNQEELSALLKPDDGS